MSWLRRLLLLAGLVTGAWLLGSAGEANADVEIKIDQLEVQLDLPVVEVGVELNTGLVPQQPPAPPVPNPRTEPPSAPQQTTPPQQPIAEAPAVAPVQAQTPKPHAPPAAQTTNPAPVPQQPPQPQAEQPINGMLPQSGVGQTGGNQIPAGTLTYAMRPPTTTPSLVSTEQQDAPRTVRAEEPTFSPD